jgi:peroxiredoxin
MALQVGTNAPDFTLRSMGADGLEDVTLSTLRQNSNVVLLFFPGAFTPVCTQELCDVTSGLPRYANLHAKVLGISPDSPYCQAKWAGLERIDIPLLSDYQHEVTAAYDVVWPNFSGLGPGTCRAVFLIDKQGVIRHVEQTPRLTDLPDLAAIEAALADL